MGGAVQWSGQMCHPGLLGAQDDPRGNPRQQLHRADSLPAASCGCSLRWARPLHRQTTVVLLSHTLNRLSIQWTFWTFLNCSVVSVDVNVCLRRALYWAVLSET